MRAQKETRPPKGPGSIDTLSVTRDSNYSSPTRGAAYELAGKGWHVLPCSPTSKAPLTPHGHHDATTNTGTITDWWTRWPTALIGAVVPDEVIVLDIDPRNGGSVTTVEKLAGRLPLTLTVHSGRADGGCHLYWQRPNVSLTGRRLPGGVDLKVNGYMIMPPSPHPDTGEPYIWDTRHLARPLPPGLYALLYPDDPPSRAGKGGPVEPLARAVADSRKGERNTTLYWALCRAFDEGSDISPIAEAGHNVGLDRIEIESTIRSAHTTAGGGQ